MENNRFDLSQSLIDAASKMLAEGRGKKGQARQAKEDDHESGDWDKDKTSKKKFTIARGNSGKKAVWDESAEQIDELSKKTLKSYVKKATTSADRAWKKTDQEEDKAMSTDGEKYPEKQQRHVDNASRHNAVWAKRDAGLDVAKKKLKEDFELIYNEDLGEGTVLTVNEDSLEVMFDEGVFTVFFDELIENTEPFEVFEFNDALAEDAGALGDYPNHVKKAITKTGGGEHSVVHNHGTATSYSNLKTKIATGLKTGHVVSVHHNGKMIGAAVRTWGSGRPEHNVFTSKEQLHAKRSQKVHNTGKYDNRAGKYIPPRFSEYTSPGHSGDETQFKLHNMIQRHLGDNHSIEDKNSYKAHNIEVKTISHDEHRKAIQAERKANKPAMQQNYVKAIKGSKEATYGDNKRTTLTPAGSMDKIKEKALEKLTDRKVKGNDSPKSKAKAIHQEIHAAIEAGDHKMVATKASELADHVRRHALTDENPKRRSFKDAVKGIRSSSKSWGGSSEWDRKQMKSAMESLEFSIVDDNNNVGTFVEFNEDNTLTFVFEGKMERIDIDSLIFEDDSN